MAHYLESEGIPTTQISLIREHTEIIRPPRALWVPFELGRPLGAPDAADFQRRVLLEALELLETSEGPVLRDFTEEAPGDGPGAEYGEKGLACPASFAPPPGNETGERALVSAFRREVAELRPWYDLNLKRRGRSTVGYFGPEDALELLSRLALGEAIDVPVHNFDLATALRLAATDLRTFYYEAVLARPGSIGLSGASAFKQWFWNKTAAGRLLRVVKERCAEEEDEALRMTGEIFLVPMDQA
ncbi:hypothetical protein LGS26_09525 [Dissulfurimicrobium hydrothermale]|nr:hypothetical protein LGS26_09525 [Dissulfurimicrobium hydrothermale]